MAHSGAFSGDVPVFQHMVRNESQRLWLKTLPGLVAELEQRWGVSTRAPFRTGTSAWVAPGTTEAGQDVVLKIVWPHREAAGEPAGLWFWAGSGAVRLIESFPAKFALLLERCRPGGTLAEANLPAEEALSLAAQLLARLWSPAPTVDIGLETVETVMRDQAAEGRERLDEYRPAYDPALVAAGIDLLESLPLSATRSVVVHGDFNPGNILRAQREPWLAIDAKPMLGDPGVDVEPLVAQVDPPFEKSDPVTVLRQRYSLVADIVDEPAERLITWAFARTVLSALWCAEHGENGEEDMAEAAVLAGLAGI